MPPFHKSSVGFSACIRGAALLLVAISARKCCQVCVSWFSIQYCPTRLSHWSPIAGECLLSGICRAVPKRGLHLSASCLESYCHDTSTGQEESTHHYYCRYDLPNASFFQGSNTIERVPRNVHHMIAMSNNVSVRFQVVLTCQQA